MDSLDAREAALRLEDPYRLKHVVSAAGVGGGAAGVAILSFAVVVPSERDESGVQAVRRGVLVLGQVLR